MIVKKKRQTRKLYLFDEYGPETEQKHLEEGTEERIYWHCGYLSALTDVLNQLRRWNARLS